MFQYSTKAQPNTGNSDEEINLFLSPSKDKFLEVLLKVSWVFACAYDTSRVVNLEGRLKGGNDYLNLNTKFLMHARAWSQV